MAQLGLVAPTWPKGTYRCRLGADQRPGSRSTVGGQVPAAPKSRPVKLDPMARPMLLVDIDGVPATPFPPEVEVTAVAAFVGERPAAWLDDVMVPEAHAWAQSRIAPTCSSRSITRPG